jgi:hypothetical protein
VSEQQKAQIEEIRAQAEVIVTAASTALNQPELADILVRGIGESIDKLKAPIGKYINAGKPPQPTPRPQYRDRIGG